jgi:hypothetical protein
LAAYLPGVAAQVRSQSPTVEDIAAALRITEVVPLPLSADMRDGVLGAHWRRPEAYLDPAVRANCSPLALAELADPATMAAAVARLEADLASGAWHRRHASLLDADSHDVGYRLLVGEDA